MNVSDRDLERYGEAFLQSFEAIRRSLTFYPSNHPNVTEQLTRFLKNLSELRERVGDATFNVAKKEFFINGIALKRISLTYERNLSAWEKLGLGLVRFDPDATVESIRGFFEVLAQVDEETGRSGGVAALLERAGIRGIRASRVVAEVSPEDDGLLVKSEPLRGVTPTDVAEARSRLRDSLGELGQIVASAQATAGQPGRMLRSLCQTIESRVMERRTVRELARQLEKHHPESYRHALGGAIVAVLMGDGMGLDRDRLTLLGEAALLRDIGLVQVPAGAIRDRHANAAAEAEFRTHPVKGAKLLLERPDIDPSAAIVSIEHHAGLDLKGWPRLRAVKGVHAFTRLVAVASDYDLWTAGYAGERKLEPVTAVRELVQGAGRAYDPSALRALLRILGFVPEGTGVRLRDHSRGVVAGIGSKSWLAPLVALLDDGSGAEIAPRLTETDGLAPPGEAVVLRTEAPGARDLERLESLRSAS